MPFNPDSLTARVIATLERENLLRKHLATVAEVAQGEAELRTALKNAAIDGTLIETVTDELRRAVKHRVAEATQRAYIEAGATACYALIESAWRISKDAGLALQLAQLRSPQGEVVDMPAGITMTVPLVSSSNACLTDRGVARLQECPDGEWIRAGVLGTTEPFVNGRLRITPIVVFDRAGAAD